jgi:diadenosine tetraphosphate (Ap4A) HIT family hydrolase
MAEVFQTENFIVEAPDHPLVDRNDGGHIKISPKIRIVDRQALSPRLAIEYMRLSMVVGQALTNVMNKHGVDIGRINYQDNGNWSVFKPEGPYFHLHIFGRAKSAKINKYGDAIYAGHRETGFYDNFKPLTKEDIADIKKETEKIFKQKKYLNKSWGNIKNN